MLSQFNKMKNAYLKAKPDLRSAKSIRLKQGVFTNILRILTLAVLDLLALSIAGHFAILYGTPLPSPWIQESQFLLLTLTVEIGMIASQGLYKAGSDRRNYLSLIKTYLLHLKVQALFHVILAVK